MAILLRAHRHFITLSEVEYSSDCQDQYIIVARIQQGLHSLQGTQD